MVSQFNILGLTLSTPGLVYIIYIMIGTKPKVVKKATLGRQPIVLGGLYTEYEEMFIPGLGIWSSQV